MLLDICIGFVAAVDGRKKITMMYGYAIWAKTHDRQGDIDAAQEPQVGSL